LGADLTVGVNKYEKGKAFVVTTDQTQYRMVRSMFEKVTSFYDSVFYDASAWTMALAYGMPHDALNATVKFTKGARISAQDITLNPAPVARTSYAYLIDWTEYNASRALYYLLSKDVFVKTAFKPFTVEVNGIRKSFGYGTLVIPVADQNISDDELFALMKEASLTAGVDVFSVNTGFSLQGVDLGSNNVRTVQPPKVAMLIGDGVAATDAGAIWYLLDSKLKMPVTKVNTSQFGQLKITDYNTLILVAGNYGILGESGVTKIKNWVQQGGTLILMKTAISWAINNKLIDDQLKKDDDKNDSKRMDYVTAGDYQGSRAIGGSIYMGKLDITHPLGFGYTSRELPVYRNTSVFIEPGKSPFNTVISYTAKPLLSGYIHPSNLEKIKNSVSLQVSNMGQGRAILFVDDPAFRGYWNGTNKLFFNALFFGSNISSGGNNWEEEH